ncbi:hypothetical protein ABZV58_28325 [Nocardia sp. NPDC004654]|uniref:hypothetical protein n=1 Tax=Nocardia sp. NPDC004654 TaxID=3154776 RepID=UPI0033B7D60F
MKLTKVALLAAGLSTALGVTAGASHAEPQAEPAAINYTADRTDKNLAIETDAGAMVVEDGVFKIKADNGATVAGAELKFRVDEFEFPIAAEISDRKAVLTPLFDIAHAIYKPVGLPYEDKAPWKSEYDREVAAWSRMTSTISLGASIATLAGGIGGAALGCAAGAVAGAALTGALLTLFGAGPIAGCIAGAAAVGFLGTLAGQIFITAPVAVLAAVQYFSTINSPMPNQAAPAK